MQISFYYNDCEKKETPNKAVDLNSTWIGWMKKNEADRNVWNDDIQFHFISFHHRRCNDKLNLKRKCFKTAALHLVTCVSSALNSSTLIKFILQQFHSVGLVSKCMNNYFHTHTHTHKCARCGECEPCDDNNSNKRRSHHIRTSIKIHFPFVTNNKKHINHWTA